MRGILSSVTARVATCLLSRPQYKNGILNVASNLYKNQSNMFSSFVNRSYNINSSFQLSKYINNSFLEPKQVSTEQIRTVIKFSWKKGTRKTVKAVLRRFYRLHWGIWIRTIAGRHKKLWKKSRSQKNRLKQHVFCNATQSRMLDTMVSRYWRKPKYYIDDPYAPYHTRETFSITRTKPYRPEGVDYE